MKKVPENELFSAYLDGELTAAEQAEVEQLLATSPAARQLMDELRALSLTLQSLPVQRVGEDLRERVLRAAERRMLANPEVAESPPHSRDALWRVIFRRLARPRNLLWPAAAVAAAWLLTTNPELGHRVPQRKGDKQVAVAPTAPRPIPARNPTIGPAHGPEHPPPPEVAVAPRNSPPAASKPQIAKSAGGENAAGSPKTATQPALPAMPPVPPLPKSSDIAASPAAAPKAGSLNTAEAGPGPKSRVSDQDADELLIVRCDVTEEAIAKGLLEKTLGKRGLAPCRKPLPPQGEAPGERVARCVEVEATTAELLAAVNDLKAQPEMFRAVSLPAGVLPRLPAAKAPRADAVAKPGVFKVEVRIGSQPMVAKGGGASFGTGTQGVQVGPPSGQSIEIRPPAPPQALDTAKRRVRFVLRVVPASSL